MLDLLHQQEKEIERLTEELNAPRDGPDPVLLNAIRQTTREAADSYLSSINARDKEDTTEISSLGSDAKHYYDVSMRLSSIVNEAAEKMLSDMRNVFMWLIELIESMRAEFEQKVGETSLGSIPAADSTDEL